MSGDKDGTSSTRRRQLLRRQHVGSKGTPETSNWRPGIEDLEDVLVAQLRDRVRLALEAIARLLVIREVLVEHLHRDLALQAPVAPAIDDRHPALAHTLEQLVLVEDLSDVDHHVPGATDIDVTVAVRPV